MKRRFSWIVSEELWRRISPLVPTQDELRDPEHRYSRRSGGGRKSKYDDRTFFSAIIYVLRTGIQWNALPRERFNGMSSTTAFEKFQQWSKSGFFDRIWESGLTEYDEFEGIDWKWQSADGCQIKSPLGSEKNGAGNNPTDRGKKRSKMVASDRGKRRAARIRNK